MTKRAGGQVYTVGLLFFLIGDSGVKTSYSIGQFVQLAMWFCTIVMNVSVSRKGDRFIFLIFLGFPGLEIPHTVRSSF